ncbi:MAG: hypothetical protein K9N46_12650 [Candidatus Marinimicrobia bacterium]|nr:hypothetical protein [Candidatus Neomarinimicrobiota bacterium]MCF7827558.1 hypothetical protein [Candidatus Neomarinimicrobiota bacterium]MCF7881580.1 hypothetical protein [Candidatus Neomarinimicrobiota bacterium]
MKFKEGKTSQYLITGIIGIILLAVIVGQTAVIYWVIKQTNLSVFILAGIVIVGLIIIVTLIFVIIDRIKEIAQEDSDETGQY